MVIGASKREILSEKLPLDLVFVSVCMCSQMGGECGGKMGAVSQPNETNLLNAHTHTHTHRAPSGQWKCHIIGFPFQDKRHAHWIRSDHRRQFPPCLLLSAFSSLFCILFSQPLHFFPCFFCLVFLLSPYWSACLIVLSRSAYNL